LELDDKTKINIYNFISQLLSHSTTQLVEKIMGEVEGLKKTMLIDDEKSILTINEQRKIHNQGIAKAVKIISKYK